MKCNTTGCDQQATQIVYWPGQTTQKCEVHAEQCRRLAQVMGFRVDVEWIAKKEEDAK